MSDIGISIALEGINAYQKGLKTIENSTDSSLGKVDKTVSSVSGSFSELAKDLPGIGTALKFISNPIGGIVAGLTGAGAALSSVINTAADFETIQIQFETIIGSVEGAQTALEGLERFSSSTPFQFESVAEAGRSLLAFGIGAEELEGTLRRIGDVSAGIGAPLGEISELYGRIAVQGRVFAEDINQLTGRGIPIIQELAKQFNVTDAEVKNLVSTGRVGFPQIEAAFVSLTSEGGKFAGLTQNLSQSFSGQLSTLGDNATAAARSFGQALLPAATSVLSTLNDLLGTSTQYSDQLEKERVEINLLVQRIGRYNEGNEDRSTLITELNSKYPSFLKNLDTESITNGELRDRLSEVNEQYINKIILQKEDEKIAEQAATFAERQRVVIENQIALEEALRATKEEFNIQVAEGLTLEQELLAVRQELVRLAQEDGGAFSEGIFDARRRELLALGNVNADYVKSLNSAGDAEEDLSVLQSQRAEIAKRLGISIDGITEATEAVPKEIETTFSVNDNQAAEKIKTLAETLDELGVSLEALERFDNLTSVFEGLPLDSVADAADRARENIVNIALDTSTPINTLQEQLSNVQAALELIDPSSAGFVVLAEQAALLEARISLVNSQLEALKEGREPNPIVFPVELDTSTIDTVDIPTPDPVEIPVDFVPLTNPFTSLEGAAEVLGTDVEFLNERFRDTGELLDLMGTNSFKFFSQFLKDIEDGIDFTLLWREALLQIGKEVLFQVGDAFEVLGEGIGSALTTPIETTEVLREKLAAINTALATVPPDSGVADSLNQQKEAIESQLDSAAALKGQYEALKISMESLPKDSEAFKIMESQANSLEKQLGILEGTTGRFSSAFGSFVDALLDTVLVAVPKMLGLFLLQSSLALSFPAGVPFAIAGLALVGLSGLAKGLLAQNAEIQDTVLGGFSAPNLDSSSVPTGPSLATNQQSAFGLSDLNQDQGQVTNVTVMFGQEDVTDLFAIAFQTNKELTG